MPYKHKADLRAAQHRWYDENKDRKAAYQKDWYKRNRTYHLAYVKERRIIRKRELCERLELAESGIRAIIAEVKKNRAYSAIAAEWLLEKADIAEIVMVYRIREAARERNHRTGLASPRHEGSRGRASTTAPRGAATTQAPPPGTG